MYLLRFAIRNFSFSEFSSVNDVTQLTERPQEATTHRRRETKFQCSFDLVADI